MQFASFDLRDPIFEVFGLRISVQVVTLENLYGVDRDRLEIRREGDTAILRASGLAWAGQQERAPGEVELRVTRQPTPLRIRASARARAPEKIRCIKLLLRDLEMPLALLREDADAGEAAENNEDDKDNEVNKDNKNDNWREVPAGGEILAYPTRLPTPLILLRAGGRTIGARAEDGEVREKRFAVSSERVGELAGRGVLELIHEEAASRFAPEIQSPPFAIAPDADPAAFLDEHLAFVERAFGLRPWEERPDLPDWARDLRLVVTLHGMHWSGRVLLDYAAMRETLRFVAEHIDPGRVLVYLPGWEGRYYWRYGDYRPDARLGGERGFAALCEGARELGFHLMPMFGVHCANAWLPRFRGLDASVYMKSATRNRFHGNLPDWDLSRAHDTGWQAWLNPGHPSWRESLAEQIEALAARYPFDAIFLDTTEVWTNDPDHSVYDGIRSLVERLRSTIPGSLLAGEYDYDALIALFPLFQRAWWIRAPAWTRRYLRRFAHLCEGEPEGRTGVHELGSTRPGPVEGEAGLLPTIAFQDGTLERARGEVERAIARAAGAS
jgi:hypothetical protein